jgi:ABC-type nickel/cobalt efflux system permease component RcnA
MITFLSMIGLGFFLGMRHATDPDHVVAVSTIVSRQRNLKAAAMVGVLWGFGHTITIFVVGSAIILFNFVIPPRLGLSMELSVGLMLILLGILNLSGILQWITKTCTRSDSLPDVPRQIHGACAHSHSPQPTNAKDWTNSWTTGGFGQLGLYHVIRPLLVGIVHGLAGSAAVALLVLATIGEPFGALVYLLVFGLGTIAGMMVITAAIAVPFTLSESRSARLNRSLAMVSSLISVCFGFFVVYQMGFVKGLFTRNPIWIPR